MKVEDRRQLLEKLYKKESFFSMKSMAYFEFFKTYFEALMKADLADNGDVSTSLVYDHFPEKMTAQLIAKSDGVFSSREELVWMCKHEGVSVSKVWEVGKSYEEGDVLAVLSGVPYKLLQSERTILNILQRMCGIATAASRFETEYTAIAVTRKTPFSFMDKRAAMDGYALPHRVNLSDAIMLKDTHLDQFGRDFDVVAETLGKTDLRGVSFVEIEVENQEEALKVAEMSKMLDLDVPMVVMLDNFTPEDIEKAVEALQEADLYKYVLVEVSGGITSENYKDYDIEGVDVMSLGEITHSVRAADISMKIV